MLRYFYLFYLLILFDWTFCYYISDQVLDRSVDRNIRNDARYVRNRLKNVKRRHHEEVDGKNSVAQIDVASFIQNPEYDGFGSNSFNEYHQNFDKRRISKGYDDYNFAKEVKDGKNLNRRDNSGDYSRVSKNNALELNNPSLHKETLNPRHLNTLSFNYLTNKNVKDIGKRNYQDDLVIDRSMVHNHKKKCSLNQFPFFSHNKSATPKPKKESKKKFHFRANKNKPSHGLSTVKDNNFDVNQKPENLEMSNTPYKIIKRSYEESICPLCKRKYMKKSSNSRSLYKRKISNEMIHNSRQAQENLNKDYNENTPENIVNFGKIQKAFAEYNALFKNVDGDDKKKRGDEAEGDKERQMKELEEVQKKLDNLDLNTPVPQNHITSN